MAPVQMAVADSVILSSGGIGDSGWSGARAWKPCSQVATSNERFSNAAFIIAGVRLMHRIRKSQFKLQANIKETAAPAVSDGVLSAR
jgi:hypothetical protein